MGWAFHRKDRPSVSLFTRSPEYICQERADGVVWFLSMHEFNQSLRYDKRMYAADIAGSIAYAKSLALVGILTEDEQKKIVDGLTAVGKEWEQGVVSATPAASFWIRRSFSM